MAVGGRMFLAPLLAAAAIAGSVAASSSAPLDDDGALLGAVADIDDECAAAFDGEEASDCSLNAIQRRALRAHKQQREEEAKRADSEEAKKGGRSAPSPPPAVVVSLSQGGVEGTAPWHYARNCWDHCHEIGGFCEWCGPDGACCNYMHQDEPECKDVSFWPVLTFHTCVHSNVKEGNSTLPDPPEGCEDITPMCAPWSDQGECDENPDYMALYCKKSCGKCTAEDEDGNSDSDGSSGEAQQEQQPAQQQPVQQQPSSGGGGVTPTACEDSNEQCYLWSLKGECDKNPGYMSVACKRSCNGC